MFYAHVMAEQRGAESISAAGEIVAARRNQAEVEEAQLILPGIA